MQVRYCSHYVSHSVVTYICVNLPLPLFNNPVTVFSDEVVKVTASEGKPASKPVPMTMTDTKRGPHSGSSVVSSSPRALEREEDESETGESEAEEMDFDEGDDGNKRKRGGDSFNLDDDEISEIDSEQEGEVQVCHELNLCASN